jgi:hypothetical protein
MSLEMAHKVIVPPKKNYIPQFLKQRDINSYFFLYLSFKTHFIPLLLNTALPPLPPPINLCLVVSGSTHYPMRPTHAFSLWLYQTPSISFCNLQPNFSTWPRPPSSLLVFLPCGYMNFMLGNLLLILYKYRKGF